MNTRESTTILGAAVFDDVIVVILLAFVMSFRNARCEYNTGHCKENYFLCKYCFIAWKVVPWIMKMLVPLRVTEALISAALIICFFFLLQ